ncbi:hypothetical protein HPP92_002609 [Vanilla planifolia]|uniref:Uncharacterized protein n=1 Tax=Vanilla planifolia TaxID=51239 RepID=A0A835VKR3_VANPL|nr:hypothetical protein HPP92_002609 [Vanilla planifolia]
MAENRGGSSSRNQEFQISFGMIPPSSSSIHASNMSKEGGGLTYDLGELDQALFLYLDGQDHSSAQEQRRIHVCRDSQHISFSAHACGANKQEQTMQIGNSVLKSEKHVRATVKQESSIKKGTTASSTEQEGPKTPDAKTLRRLAQNREAARKSRLRKKAYVQQLENSRIRLSQLEQELQRTKSQGAFFGHGALVAEPGLPQLGSDAAMFEMEYARWTEEHRRLVSELHAAVQEQLPEHELRVYVDSCLSHHDEMASLTIAAAKADVFHLVSGVWKTPAERCFLWLGGFRPSDLVKILLSHMEPLTEQQILGICGMQQSTHEAEEALTQGLEALHSSLSDTISSDVFSCPSNMANYMGQMALAMNKLSSVEGFVRQAESLRQHTLHRLRQILTVRQAARCFLAIAEYFHRLRALSSLWLARPRQEQ